MSQQFQIAVSDGKEHSFTVDNNNHGHVD